MILNPQTLQVSLYSAFGLTEEKPDAENSEWREARRLKKGDVLFDSTGRQLRIRDVSVEKRRESVYNFTVEGEHDYYVGEEGVLVHNRGCGNPAEGLLGNDNVDTRKPPKLSFWDSTFNRPGITDETSGQFTGRIEKRGGYFGGMFGAEIWYEKVEGPSPPHFSRIDSVQGDNGQEFKYERKEFEGNKNGERIKEDILWSGTGRNGVQNGSYDADKNGNQVAYHRIVDGAGKQTLVGQNGLFTSGFIGESDYEAGTNKRKTGNYRTDPLEGKPPGTVTVRAYRNMSDKGAGGEWIMAQYERRSDSETNDALKYRISKQEQENMRPRADGTYPAAYLTDFSDPVHDANVNYPSIQTRFADHRPGHPTEVHKDGHFGIDAMTETLDLFSSKGGLVKMPSSKDFIGYNEITVQFPDKTSQTMFHLSGNASYIFPGQVMKAGEYIGRRGGMGVGQDHLHLAYRNKDKALLNVEETLKHYAPEKKLDGKTDWKCQGVGCSSWIKGE